ncbi:MAG: polyprenyl synthetase family protein [Planctomycetota bacterium]
MSQAPPDPDTQKTLLRELLACVSEELGRVDQRLKAELRHDDPFIDDLAQHSFRIGGKRLRPALLLLAGQAVGELNDDHVTLATVVEMVHTATLVHDDVLDEASVRRHAATVNARWGNVSSVLLGDYLFTHAFYLASTLETTFGCRTIGQATNLVCEGELRQTASIGNFWLSREDYLEIIDAKTASLCSCSCRLGAHYAGAKQEDVDRFARFGTALGVAFQIADDVLDLEGVESTAGKSLGTDLTNHKMTLPLIHLRDKLPSERRGLLQELLEQPTAENRQRLSAWLGEHGSLDHARGVAVQYAEQAVAELKDLPESEAKTSILQLTHFAAVRST